MKAELQFHSNCTTPYSIFNAYAVNVLGFYCSAALDINCPAKKLLEVLPQDLVYNWLPYGSEAHMISDSLAIRLWNNGVQIYAKNIQIIDSFIEQHKQYFITDGSKTAVDYYYDDPTTGICSKTLYVAHKVRHEIYPDLYPDIDIEKLAKAFKQSLDSILILRGQPGVGKTTFLKYLLAVGDYTNAGYTKDMEIMLKSKFWTDMTVDPPEILVLDDLDFALGARAEKSDNTFLSNLLSYSDGIFGIEHRSKIVITTNQPVENIDPALVRPGRCFDFVELTPLSIGDALTFWKSQLGHSEGSFWKHFSGEAVFQSELMTQHRLLSEPDRKNYMKRGEPMKIQERLGALGIQVGKSSSCGFLDR